MLHGQQIAFVFIIDNNSNMMPEMKNRIWDHEKLVNKFLRNEVCVMGRKTHELTGWKGPKSWVLTRDKNWRRIGIGTISSLDDIHLHTDTDIVYILGGSSLFNKLKNNVDIMHMFVINNKEGSVKFPKLTMKEWKPIDYKNSNIWSYGHLEKKEIIENRDYLFD